MSVRIRTFVSERADPQTWVRGPILPKCRGWAFGRPWFWRPAGIEGTWIDCPRWSWPSPALRPKQPIAWARLLPHQNAGTTRSGDGASPRRS